MLEIIYKIIIMPLIYVYEIVFGLSKRLSIKIWGNGNTDIELFFCIIIISIVVNILTLSFYIAADRVKLNEKLKQDSMKRTVDHIKHTFKGDERFMVLNAYYRLENYNPIYSLRTAIPLLLQIPFFTAAYIFFVNLPAFNGTPLFFLPIVSDLSKPDRIISAFSMKINLFPIIMTVINIISSLIYTRGLSLKDKLQPIILAIVFFVLLYDSPSALVIYWTFNNIFSLFRIIVLQFFNTDINRVEDITVKPIDRDGTILTISSLLCLLFIFALLIPTNIIVASPREFIINNLSPYNIIQNSFFVFLGMFLWMLFYYKMADDKIKKVFSVLIFVISIYCIINYFVYNNYGIITENLVYTEGFKRFSISDIKKDLIIFICCFVIFLLLYKLSKFTKYSVKISVLIGLSILSFSILNIFKINSMTYNNDLVDNKSEAAEVNFDGKLKLSKTGKNVIVIMLDKSCGKYVDYVFSDMPELKNIYDGFTFFDNAIACSTVTLIGSTPLFGGYDYLPQNANKLKDVLLVDKHNNALKLMPYNFSNNGYDCVVANLPYENYEDRNRESIFNDMKNVTEIDLTNNIDKYLYSSGVDTNKSYEDLKRKFIIYSIMRTCPRVFQGVLYDRGMYLQNSEFKSMHSVRYYCAINNMIDKCNILNDNSNNFWMIDNELTHNHDNVIYPYGSFSPIASSSNASEYPIIVNSYGEIFNGQYAHLSTEYAAYIQIGRFLNFLKENGVYDNTRIVITSDHGCHIDVDLDNSYDINLGDGVTVPTCAFNCVLFFKDFNEKGELSIKHDFMVNADVPLLAMRNIFEPYDFFLNRFISLEEKNIDSIDIFYPSKGANGINYMNDCTFDSYQFSCKPTNIFAPNSWYIKEKETDYD